MNDLLRALVSRTPQSFYAAGGDSTIALAIALLSSMYVRSEL
jgi:hypothetical protein